MHLPSWSQRLFLVLAFGLGIAAFSADLSSAIPNAATGKAASPDLSKLQAMLKDAKTPRTWLFTGDSITHGARWTAGRRSFPEIFAERVRWELRRMDDIVINTGISGNKAKDILDNYDWRVRRFKPDVVILLVGMNDCAAKDLTPELFGERLTALVKNIRADGGIPVLETPNTVKPGSRDHALPPFVAQIRKVAEAENAILVDHAAVWEQAAKGGLPAGKWMADAIHPSAEGHRQMAVAIFKALGIHDPKSACETVAIP